MSNSFSPRFATDCLTAIEARTSKETSCKSLIEMTVEQENAPGDQWFVFLEYRNSLENDE